MYHAGKLNDNGTFKINTGMYLVSNVAVKIKPELKIPSGIILKRHSTDFTHGYQFTRHEEYSGNSCILFCVALQELSKVWGNNLDDIMVMSPGLLYLSFGLRL